MKPVLIMLDALVDCNFSILKNINENLCLKALENGYLTRDHNRFDILTGENIQEEYRRQYNGRDKTILMDAKLTLFASTVRQANKDQSLNKNAPDVCELTEVVINFHPYKLSQEEQQEYLLQFKELLLLTNISGDELPYAQLQLDFLNARYSAFVINDLNEWLNPEYGVLQKPSNKLFPIYAPIFLTDVGYDIDPSSVGLGRAAEQGFSQFFNLNPLTLGDLSLCHSNLFLF